MANNKNIKINLDYAQFSSGISDCQRKMGLLTSEFKLQQAALGNNASEVDRLKVSQDSLNKKIELQQQIVEKASERFKALSESEGATSSQIDKAQKSLTDQITKLYDLGNQIEQVNDRLIELSEAEEEAGKSANESAGNTENLANVITSTVAIASEFASAIREVASAVIEAARSSAEWADNLNTMANQIGVSTQTLQEWAYAANFTDTSLQTMESSMSRLTRQMGEAQNGSTSAQAAFDNLGVSVTNADGSLRSAESVFYEVIDALGNIPNKAEQDAAAMDIFGKSAQELTGLIDAGSEGLRAYAEEANNLGVVLSGDQVAALNQMQDAFDQLDSVMQASSNRIQANLAPAITVLTNAFSSMNPTIVDSINVVGRIFSIYSNLAPTLSHTATLMNTLKIAKGADVIATKAEAAAEVELGIATGATNMALSTQVILIGAMVLAVVGLFYVIKQIAEALGEYAAKAEYAAESTKKFTDAASGAESSSNSNNSSSSGTKHYALGGRVSGGKSVWVGEQGAELVDLPVGSYIHNTTETNQISNGGNVTNITVNVDHISELQDLLNISQQAKQRARMGVVTA